jgi:hypothetical protein
MMFADAIPVPSSEHVVTLGTLGTLIAGIVAWILKSAIPSLLDRFLVELQKREDRLGEVLKEHRDEREAMDARHTQEIERCEADRRQLAGVVDGLKTEVQSLKDKLLSRPLAAKSTL